MYYVQQKAATDGVEGARKHLMVRALRRFLDLLDMASSGILNVSAAVFLILACTMCMNYGWGRKNNRRNKKNT